MQQFCSIFIILFIILLPCRLGAETNDSLQIVSLFQSALHQPEKLDSFRNIASEIVKKKSTENIEDVYHFNYAKVLFQTGQLDSALQTAEHGLEWFGNDSLNYKTSKFYNIKASIYAYKSMYKEAIEEFKKTVEILEKHDDEIKAALVKSNIANLFFSLTDYESAFEYSSESYQVLKRNNDSINLPGISAIVAISAIKKGDVEIGRSMTNESLILSERHNNPIGLIVANLSLGELRTIEEKYDEAVTAYLHSLDYSVKYQQKHYIMLNKIGLLVAELNRNNYHEALEYGHEALAESQNLGNENTKYAILKNIGFAYSGLNQFEKAFNYAKESHNLYIETANIENKAIINELLIKYDSEKKEKEILKKDLELAEQEIAVNKRTYWIIALVLLLIVGSIAYLLYRQKQKEKLQKIRELAEKNSMLAAIEGEENERERLANELHDGIASTLTGIRYKLEQSDSKTTINETIEQLQLLHEDTRRISHNLMPISLQNKSLSESISSYCQENSSDKFTIHFNNLTKQPFNFNAFKKHTIYRIVQELVNNSRKHSESNHCIVQISKNDEITITIEDDGVGFDFNNLENSQGLKSIEKRMKQINGVMKIDSAPGKGTLVLLILKNEA